MEIGDRIKILRKTLGLTQAQFAAGINLKPTVIGMYENNQRSVLDRNLLLICIQYNVNEEWLRFGTGEMFKKSESMTLDEFAKLNNLSDEELEIMRLYMSIDPGIRKGIIDGLKSIFLKDKNEKTSLSLVARGGKDSITVDSKDFKDAIKKDTSTNENDNKNLF